MVVLSKFQNNQRTKIIEFANSIINKEASLRDEQGTFDSDLWKACSQIGLHNLQFTDATKEDSSNLQDSLSTLESVGFAFRDNGLSFGICAQLTSVSSVLKQSDKIASDIVEKINSGDIVVAHAITENSSGSDAFKMNSQYEATEEGFHIDAQKTYCSNLIPASHVLLYAKNKQNQNEISAFLISKECLEEIVEIKKMGLNTCIMGKFKINSTLPKSSLISNKGTGAGLFNEGITLERLGMAALHLGTIERLLKECIEWINNRSIGDDNLSEKQAITHPIVTLYQRWSTLRAAIYYTSSTKPKFSKLYMQASILKDQVSELYVDACTQILQSYGGLGYTKELEIERMLRDAIASKIYSGTSEIQKEIIWKLIK